MSADPRDGAPEGDPNLYDDGKGPDPGNFMLVHVQPMLQVADARFIAGILWMTTFETEFEQRGDLLACALMSLADSADPNRENWRRPANAIHCATCGAYQPLQLNGLLRVRCLTCPA